MSWRTTGILFVVLLLLGGVVYWQSRQEPDVAAEPTLVAPGEQAPNPLEGVAVANVERLDIESGGDGASASFRHEADGSWYMTVPTATQVMSSTLTNSIQTLIGAGSQRAFSPEENPLDAYGLENPSQTVTFAVRREQDLVQYRLRLGNTTPADDAYYVLKQGDSRIYLMSKSGLDAILNLASEPPLPPTPAPEVTPTAAP